MKQPTYTASDFWAHSGRQYVPASATDIRATWRKLGLIEIDRDGERDVPIVRLGESVVPEARKAK